jgi:hypothetical protein
MTSVLNGQHDVQTFEPPTGDTRLVFTPARTAPGVLDGCWWPRTHDLSKELPTVLAAVASRLGAVVARISASASLWDATPEHISAGNQVVDVAWFRACDAHTIRLLTGGSAHLDLLVIPPETTADTATAALTMVARGQTADALHAIGTGTISSPCLR